MGHSSSCCLHRSGQSNGWSGCICHLNFRWILIPIGQVTQTEICEVSCCCTTDIPHRVSIGRRHPGRAKIMQATQSSILKQNNPIQIVLPLHYTLKVDTQGIRQKLLFSKEIPKLKPESDIYQQCPLTSDCVCGIPSNPPFPD